MMCRGWALGPGSFVVHKDDGVRSGGLVPCILWFLGQRANFWGGVDTVMYRQMDLFYFYIILCGFSYILIKAMAAAIKSLKIKFPFSDN